MRLQTAAEAVAPLWQEHGREPRPFGGTYHHLYLDIYPPSLQTADMAHVPRTQPLRPEAFATGAPEPLPAWLTDASAAPLVYVTFGTVFNADLTAVGTVVEALRDQPVRVVVTLGPSADPQALGPQPDNVHVARYILRPSCWPTARR